MVGSSGGAVLGGAGSVVGAAVGAGGAAGTVVAGGFGGTVHPATAAAAGVPAYHRPLVSHTFEGNRIVQRTGCRFPIFNAPVGYFARAQLAGAVSAAGGMGLMETSSAGPRRDGRRVRPGLRARTDAPLGLQMFLRVLKGQGRVDEVLDWVLDGRTPLLVTCVGDPTPIARRGQGGRRAALPPGRQPQRRPAGGRRRRRRARSSRAPRAAGCAACGRRTCSPSCSRSAAAVDVPLDRRRRHRRRPRHGRRLRPRRRGRPHGHAVHELGREPGARQLEAGHHRLRRDAQHRSRACPASACASPAPSSPRPCSVARSTRPATPTPGRSSRRSSTAASTRRWSGAASRRR